MAKRVAAKRGSLLNASFNAEQNSCLEDNIEVSIVLRCCCFNCIVNGKIHFWRIISIYEGHLCGRHNGAEFQELGHNIIGRTKNITCIALPTSQSIPVNDLFSQSLHSLPPYLHFYFPLQASIYTLHVELDM